MSSRLPLRRSITSAMCFWRKCGSCAWAANGASAAKRTVRRTTRMDRGGDVREDVLRSHGDAEGAGVPRLAGRLLQPARAQRAERLERRHKDGRFGRDLARADERAEGRARHDAHVAAGRAEGDVQAVEPREAQRRGSGFEAVHEAVDPATGDAVEVTGDDEEAALAQLGGAGDGTAVRGPATEEVLDGGHQLGLLVGRERAAGGEGPEASGIREGRVHRSGRSAVAEMA